MRVQPEPWNRGIAWAWDEVQPKYQLFYFLLVYWSFGAGREVIETGMLYGKLQKSAGECICVILVSYLMH